MIPQTAEYWIDKLKLQKHPEGGYFREIFRSNNKIPGQAVDNIEGERSTFTSIYYLLKGNDFSAFHRIKSEEMWHFFNGSPVTIYVITGDGKLEKKHLGPDPDNMEDFQICIPGNTWFAAKVNNPVLYSLVGCTVSPGFDFNDFEIAERAALINEFPHLKDCIQQLTRV
jgi:uncharacterized protein